MDLANTMMHSAMKLSTKKEKYSGSSVYTAVNAALYASSARGSQGRFVYASVSRTCGVRNYM